MSNEPVLNGRYRLVAQLGSGGMAVIYKAIDLALERTVAVKILRPSLTDDPAFLTRFRNEARSVANLAHPNIVTVHDVGHDGQTQYIVMEFIEGRDLKKIIRTEGALTIDRALYLGVQICQGIGFAHRAGLVHADVKPQNILVTREDAVKVTDFGIAQAFSYSQPSERQSVVWGSPHYFSPEQARGEKPTPASDVYSIGIVLFELLTGRLPYTGDSQQELAIAHIQSEVPLVADYNPNVPESLSRIVRKVMSKEPAARYRMSDQLAQILIGYRDRGRQPTMSTPSGYPPPPIGSTPPPIGSTPPPQAPLPEMPTIQRPGSGAPARPAPLSAESTPHYPLAPQIPSYSQQPQQVAVPRPNTLPSQSGGLEIPPPPSGSTGGYTGGFRPQTGPQRRQEVGSAFDGPTILLAILALIAVLGLIPLYIVVYIARG